MLYEVRSRAGTQLPLRRIPAERLWPELAPEAVAQLRARAVPHALEGFSWRIEGGAFLFSFNTRMQETLHVPVTATCESRVGLLVCRPPRRSHRLRSAGMALRCGRMRRRPLWPVRAAESSRVVLVAPFAGARVSVNGHCNR